MTIILLILAVATAKPKPKLQNVLEHGLLKMNYYDTIAKGYNKLHYEEQLKKYRIVKDNLKIKKSGKLLDVACGTGIARIFNCNVNGTDSSERLLKQCRGIRKILANAEELPFPDKSFDFVTCITAMHNFNSINKAIKEIKRVAKNVVVISVLKKSAKYGSITEEVKKNFVVDKIVDEEKDTILFLHNKL